jgi:hypothetical protein
MKQKSIINNFKTEWFCPKCKNEYFSKSNICPYCKHNKYSILLSKHLSKK